MARIDEWGQAVVRWFYEVDSNGQRCLDHGKVTLVAVAALSVGSFVSLGVRMSEKLAAQRAVIDILEEGSDVSAWKVYLLASGKKSWSKELMTMGWSIVVLGGLYGLIREMQGKGRGENAIERIVDTNREVTFEHVIGHTAAKQALGDIVSYLKNPSSFKNMGVKPSKGVLLHGPTGSGKTLLVRAMAGETGCPVFTVSASSFDKVYVGSGPLNVRRLFEVARENSPCTVFIQELDVVGDRDDLAGSKNNRIATVNQLLAELDGFVARDLPVFVIADTNRKEAIDKALIRPGRFDRLIPVELPSKEERVEILRFHANKISLSSDNFEPVFDYIAKKNGWALRG